jgi:RNA recognition motif-containing protein
MFVNLCSGKMKAIFCGNFEYDCRESELERLFRRYGKVDRVDMKAGKFLFGFFSSIS